MSTKTYVAAGTLAVALLATTGCGSSDSGSKSNALSQPPTSAAKSSSTTGTKAGNPAAQPVVITIEDFGYKGPASVAPGASVTVKNSDSVNHTVTADSGEFDVTVNAGSSATFTAPSKAGSYKYHCTFHANMHGTLSVK